MMLFLFVKIQFYIYI